MLVPRPRAAWREVQAPMGCRVRVQRETDAEGDYCLMWLTVGDDEGPLLGEPLPPPWQMPRTPAGGQDTICTSDTGEPYCAGTV